MKKTVLSILLSMLWVSLSEFVRNQFLFIDTWRNHYSQLGVKFPEAPVNGAIWGVWALVFSILLWLVSKKFPFIQTSLIGWIAGFWMMWLVIGNMGVLPYSILIGAIPLSALEVLGAVWIIKKINP